MRKNTVNKLDIDWKCVMGMLQLCKQQCFDRFADLKSSRTEIDSSPCSERPKQVVGKENIKKKHENYSRGKITAFKMQCKD